MIPSALLMGTLVLEAIIAAYYLGAERRDRVWKNNLVGDLPFPQKGESSEFLFQRRIGITKQLGGGVYVFLLCEPAHQTTHDGMFLREVGSWASEKE